jgi:5'-nucleotidase
VKRAITFVGSVAVLSIVAVGCARKNAPQASAPLNESVADVSAPDGAGYQPQTAPQPVVYDTATVQAQPTATPDAGAGLGAAGGTYTVKKGDTLYAIAKNRYGDGKQWVRIAEANPGLRPETLKAGQTITLP